MNYRTITTYPNPEFTLRGFTLHTELDPLDLSGDMIHELLTDEEIGQELLGN